MVQAHIDLARAFMAGLTAGALPDDLLTADMTAWTTSSGIDSSRERYQGGVRLLSSIFTACTYVIDSLTAQDDRVAVEAHMEATLTGGEPFANRYVFMLRVRDGRIAHVAEHFNPGPVAEKIVPLLQAVMAKAPAN